MSSQRWAGAGLAAFLLLCAGGHAQEPPGPHPSGPGSLAIRHHIARGDSAFRRFDNEASFAFYQKALAISPRHYAALWRCSRASVDIGEHLPREGQLPFYETALAFADSAVAADPSGWEGYTYRAISLGKMALFRGVWRSIGFAKRIRQDLHTALKLNPDNDIAMYVLARTHQKVAEKSKLVRIPLGLAWASRAESRRLYEAAIRYRPNLVLYHIDYARLLIQMKDYDGARSVLQRIGEMPIIDQDDAFNQGNASKLLQTLPPDP